MAIKTFGTAMRVDKGVRGMSAGTEMTVGDLFVRKEGSGSVMDVTVAFRESSGYAKVRLDRDATLKLIDELRSTLE